MNAWTTQSYNAWKHMVLNNLNVFVTVDYNSLRRVVDKYKFDKLEVPSWRFPGVYPEREWAYAASCITASVFNAAYNLSDEPGAKFSVINPDDPSKPFTGAFAMYRTLYAHFGETIIQARDLWPHVKNPEAMSLFFGGIKKMPHPELKSSCGIDYALGLEKHFQGNPLNIIEEALVWDEFLKRKVLRAFNGGKGLVELLVSRFPVAFGEDVQLLHGFAFPFYKRAQLVAVLLHGRALDSWGVLPAIADINEVGPIADYEVPKALRHLGILKFSDELVHRVDSWLEISKDSAMEIEIRASMVHAFCELMLNFRGQRGYGEVLNICHLDYWLWKMGKEAKHLRPHLTRTSAY